MSGTPKIAGTRSIKVDLEEGKKYAWCSCGESINQPFSDGSHAGTEFKPHVFVAEQSGPAYLCMCKHTANIPRCDGAHNRLTP